jgi:transcription antitermination factor NusG
VLKTRDQIQWASAGAVEALEASEASRQEIYQPDAPWRVGAVVAPASGPFAQHQGVVLEIRGNRAVLAMLLFGELRTVSIAVSSLVARE